MAAPNLQNAIEHLVRRWLAAPTDPELVEAVRVSGALPVYMGWAARCCFSQTARFFVFPGTGAEN